MASLYYSMLFTNWGYPTVGASTAVFFEGKSNASFWVQYTAVWWSILVYLLSLLAPIVFPDRDF